MYIFLDIIVLCPLNNSYSAYSPAESQWRPNLTFHNKDVEHSLYVYWTFVFQLLRNAASFHHPLLHWIVWDWGALWPLLLFWIQVISPVHRELRYSVTISCSLAVHYLFNPMWPNGIFWFYFWSYCSPSQKFLPFLLIVIYIFLY